MSKTVRFHFLETVGVEDVSYEAGKEYDLSPEHAALFVANPHRAYPVPVKAPVEKRVTKAREKRSDA